MRFPGKFPARTLITLGLTALVGSGCAADAPQDVLQPAGDYARDADRLWDLVFPIAVAVFVLVEGVLIFAVIRYRHRPGRKAAQFHGNTKVEVALTVMPALLLAGIAVPTVGSIFSLSEKPEGALEVTVVGHQFWFEYQYPQHDVVTANEMHIPVETPVYVTTEGRADDGLGNAEVIHSFWVPRLAGKQDVVPGRTANILLEADEPGVYQGQCTEYCGLSHANMRVRVIAESQSDFEAWIASQQQPPPPGGSALAAEGAKLFQGETGDISQPCIGCHVIEPDQPASVGPNLAHFASRDYFAGAIFRNTDENLANWLRDPPGEKPGALMPDLGLSEDQITALIAYLRTLE
jgi:cytochrome c oxidase subunit II